LGSVPHAGETVGPESVWAAIRSLHADRIGHGVRSVEDPVLLDYLAEHAVTLEVSMTSNVLLGVASSIEEHQLPRLLAAGIPVTLNTDDPAYFGTDLSRELELARRVHGLGLDQLAALQRTAIDASFAPAEVKRDVRDELAAFTS
ncbi:MAG: adenosine deaminase, partial [Acidimicrobiia bacterium]|nr:adenosine deaminase [Acidimicrobiia bacterium]